MDLETVDYINNKITELQMENFNNTGCKDSFSEGKDRAYRECIRICSDILNKSH